MDIPIFSGYKTCFLDIKHFFSGYIWIFQQQVQAETYVWRYALPSCNFMWCFGICSSLVSKLHMKKSVLSSPNRSLTSDQWKVPRSNAAVLVSSPFLRYIEAPNTYPQSGLKHKSSGLYMATLHGFKHLQCKNLLDYSKSCWIAIDFWWPWIYHIAHLGNDFFGGAQPPLPRRKRSICRPSKRKVPCQGISLTLMALDVQRNFEMLKDDLTILNVCFMIYPWDVRFLCF